MPLPSVEDKSLSLPVLCTVFGRRAVSAPVPSVVGPPADAYLIVVQSSLFMKFRVFINSTQTQLRSESS